MTTSSAWPGTEGEVLERFTVGHDAAGLREMAARLLRAGSRRSASSEATGRSWTTLLEAGLTVFVIPHPRSRTCAAGTGGREQGRPVRRLRAGRVVRTDARRLRPLERDSDQTTPCAGRPRPPGPGRPPGRRANQLRAHLQAVFPAAAALFADVDSEITLAFLEPLHHPGAGGLAVAEAAGRLAEVSSPTAGRQTPRSCTPGCWPRPAARPARTPAPSPGSPRPGRRPAGLNTQIQAWPPASTPSSTPTRTR